MQKKIRVGLLFGGRSGEHEVSIVSAVSVYNALDKSRYEVTMIAIDKEGRWIMPNPQSLLEQTKNPKLIKLNKTAEAFSLVAYPSPAQMVPVTPATASAGNTVPQVDVILPILHGTFGEDGTIQGLLELAQIPYAGSGVLGSAIGMDKDVACRLLQQAGIDTVPTLCFRQTDYAADGAAVEAEILKQFSLPVFVKPANAGSSVGVHKVKTREQLGAALKDAFSFDLKVLVQKAVDARELECAVLGNDQAKASIVGEIVPRHEFYSYEAKYIDENGADLHVPAKNLPEGMNDKVRAWSLQAFKVLDCRGMARVDFFLDRKTGRLYLNEINTIPGFTSISMYPKLWEASGLPYPQLLDELIRLALEYSTARRKLKTSIY